MVGFYFTLMNVFFMYMMATSGSTYINIAMMVFMIVYNIGVCGKFMTILSNKNECVQFVNTINTVLKFKIYISNIIGKMIVYSVVSVFLMNSYVFMILFVITSSYSAYLASMIYRRANIYTKWREEKCQK